LSNPEKSVVSVGKLFHILTIRTLKKLRILELKHRGLYYSPKCRTVGTYSPRRNHGRATASRQTEKTVDTRH